MWPMFNVAVAVASWPSIQKNTNPWATRSVEDGRQLGRQMPKKSGTKAEQQCKAHKSVFDCLPVRSNPGGGVSARIQSNTLSRIARKESLLHVDPLYPTGKGATMDLLDDDAILMATAEQGSVGNLLRNSVHNYHPHGYYHDVDEEKYYHSRYLQTNFTATEGLTDTEIIRTTCKLYGSVFLALFVVFLVVRQAYPSVYNLKKTYEQLYIPLASQPYGMISWMWSVFVVQYDDIAEQCGMDAVTTIRMFEFGIKISFIAVLNSTYLFPIYKFMGTVVTNDNAKEFSLSNLPSYHNGTIATAIAAYIFFGFAMHFVDKVRYVCLCVCIVWICLLL